MMYPHGRGARHFGMRFARRPHHDHHDDHHHERHRRHGGGRHALGRFFAHGDLRLVILNLIADKPRHGYELIKDIEQQFGGAYAPSPGSVYPTLTLLEELGQIAATLSDGSKKLFSITEEGRQFLKDNAAQVEGVRARMDMAARAMSGETPPDAVFQSMHTLKAALMFHRGAWSDEEVQRVRKIIEQAAQDIASSS